MNFYTPNRSVRINNSRNNDTNIMTRVLTDSTTQITKPNVQSQNQPASKEGPVVARKPFHALDNSDNPNPIVLRPKTLTASPPTFDRKSENVELFEDLFRNNKNASTLYGNPKSKQFPISTPCRCAKRVPKPG